MYTSYYKVGGWRLAVDFHNDSDEALLASFRPFRDEAAGDVLLHVSVCDDYFWPDRGHEIGQFDCGGCMTGVYRTQDGYYIFVINNLEGNHCATLHADALFCNCEVALHVSESTSRHYGLNNALMMSYAFASADKMTMLMHASVIRHAGRAYVMTAPSGTGKSTHTRLWYDNIPGCDLMNDDNPVVRIVDGTPILYGSPWSGKTPCYRNIQAPIGGIVRLWQKPENSIWRMSPIDAFVNLLPAMSNMKWDRRVYDGICDGVTELIRLCGVHGLGCLPDADAAHLCHDTLTPEGCCKQ